MEKEDFSDMSKLDLLDSWLQVDWIESLASVRINFFNWTSSYKIIVYLRLATDLGICLSWQ
jgi:hypothetical protein